MRRVKDMLLIDNIAHMTDTADMTAAPDVVERMTLMNDKLTFWTRHVLLEMFHNT